MLSSFPDSSTLIVPTVWNVACKNIIKFCMFNEICIFRIKRFCNVCIFFFWYLSIQILPYLTSNLSFTIVVLSVLTILYRYKTRRLIVDSPELLWHPLFFVYSQKFTSMLNLKINFILKISAGFVLCFTRNGCIARYFHPFQKSINLYSIAFF